MSPALPRAAAPAARHASDAAASASASASAAAAAAAAAAGPRAQASSSGAHSPQIDAHALQTGDLVLFNRPCEKMALFPQALCRAAKLASGSHFDHVGMVVVRGGVPHLLEANLGGGVTLRPWAERLARTTATEVAVRPLHAPRSPAMVRELEAWVGRVVGRPYRKPGFFAGQLLQTLAPLPAAGASTSAAGGREGEDGDPGKFCSELVAEVRFSAGTPPACPSAPLPGLPRPPAPRSVREKRASARDRAPFAPLFNRGQGYAVMGLLPGGPAAPAPDRYLPSDFGSGDLRLPRPHIARDSAGGGVALLAGARLGPERFLKVLLLV